MLESVDRRTAGKIFATAGRTANALWEVEPESSDLIDEAFFESMSDYSKTGRHKKIKPPKSVESVFATPDYFSRENLQQTGIVSDQIKKSLTDVSLSDQQTWNKNPVLRIGNPEAENAEDRYFFACFLGYGLLEKIPPKSFFSGCEGLCLSHTSADINSVAFYESGWMGSELRSLEIAGLEYDSLPGCLMECDSLEELDVSGSKKRELADFCIDDPVFRGLLGNLKKLRIADRDLNNKDFYFLMDFPFTHLNVSGNENISEINLLGKRIRSSLEYLDISGTSIRNLDFVSDLPNLRVLLSTVKVKHDYDLRLSKSLHNMELLAAVFAYNYLKSSNLDDKTKWACWKNHTSDRIPMVITVEENCEGIGSRTEWLTAKKFS